MQMFFMRQTLIFLALVVISQMEPTIGEPDKKGENVVTGIVAIEDRKYRVACNCPHNVQSLENMIYLSRGLCHPSKIKVRTNGHSDLEEFKLIHNVFRLLPHEDFKNVAMFHIASMDGRVKGKNFYAPGGDLGLFTVSMLNHYSGGSIPNQEAVTSFLRQYVKQLPEGRAFYHATDSKAIDTIRTGLEWEIIDITNIDKTYQKRVKELLNLGAHGDPFMKFLIDKYHNYPEKKNLVLFCINAFFEVVWDKEDSAWENLILEILEGDISPSAVVEVSVSKGCQLSRMVPQVPAAMDSKHQLLIYTEAAANQRKGEMATYLYKQHVQRDRNIPLDELVQHLDKLVHTLMEEFVSRNVDVLRFYNITFV